MESQYFIKYGVLKILSEQQLVDCDTTNYGCNGGTVGSAINSIKYNGGAELAADYGPYTAVKGTCKFVAAKAAIKINFYYVISGLGNEPFMRDYLWNYGPLSVAINADPLQYYVKGILDLDSTACDPTQLNHAVNVVGYGTENGKDYWIVRNHWGTNWGEAGYFRLARGTGVCGIDRYVTRAVVI